LNDQAYLFDSNIWVALTFSAHPAHSIASSTFLTTTPLQKAHFCRSTEQSFLRLISTPAIMRVYGVPEMTNRLALELLARFQQTNNVGYQDEPPGVIQLWHRFADRPTASPKVWMDAYLAAFSIAAGLTLVTLDRDFQAYESHGLRWQLLTLP
jgi:uncharacterized protein